VARNGLFGGRTEDERATGTVDRDRDGVDDREESRSRIPSRADRADDNRDLNRDGTTPPPPPPAPVERVEPVEPTSPATPTAPPVRVAPARASMTATLGLMIGLIGIATALTGRLAPLGIALGVVGLLLSLTGAVAGAKPHVAGRGLGAFGVLLSAAAIVFAILAMTHTASWLDSDVDQVAKLRDWLDVQMPWMSSW
jgi:hypothetical protein